MNKYEKIQYIRLRNNPNFHNNISHLALLRYAKTDLDTTKLLRHDTLDTRMSTDLLYRVGCKRLVKALVRRFNMYTNFPLPYNPLRNDAKVSRIHLWIWSRMSVFWNIPSGYMVRETEAIMTYYISS